MWTQVVTEAWVGGEAWIKLLRGSCEGLTEKRIWDSYGEQP